MQESALPVFFEHIKQQLLDVPNEIRRVFHGRGRCYDGLDQLTADWVNGQLLVHVFKEPSPEFIVQFKQDLVALSHSAEWQHAQGKTIVLQHRYGEGAPSETLVGELDSTPIAIENDLKYQLDIGRNQNFGLFLDMRLGRQWVQEQARHANVLNLFSYTCGFSVAAIEGGADQVVNVDMAKSSLSKGKTNHKLNGHDLAKVKFLGHDIFKSWGKIKKSGPYDLIVIDPPSFQKGSFALTKDYAKILRRLPDLLTDQGKVMACVNSPQVSPDFLIEGMKTEAPMLDYKGRLENPEEFKDHDPDAALKVMLFERNGEA
ncbi:class I SAM-dependent methyltransferase [Vibrio sp.]|nr:class I SAM-dependent methyltransferase [Vibrio sp.]